MAFSYSTRTMPTNFPAPFLQRLKELYSQADCEKVLSGLSVERLTSFRVNTLLADSKAVLDRLGRQGLIPGPLTGCQTLTP